jgi:hypothetical protein
MFRSIFGGILHIISEMISKFLRVLSATPNRHNIDSRVTDFVKDQVITYNFDTLSVGSPISGKSIVILMDSLKSAFNFLE